MNFITIQYCIQMREHIAVTVQYCIQMHEHIASTRNTAMHHEELCDARIRLLVYNGSPGMRITSTLLNQPRQDSNGSPQLDVYDSSTGEDDA